jgi:small GTP-binding protein
MSNESKVKAFKVVMLGESGVGKTSIISQFIDQIFQDDLQSSTGGTFSTKTFIYNKDKELKFEIWDTAGQERYRALTKMFYKDANAAVLVYDKTLKETFDELKGYWIAQIKEYGPKDLILVLCANKNDLDEEKVDEGEAREYAKTINASYCLTSAKNRYGIDDLFLSIAKKYTRDENAKIKSDDDASKENSEPQEEDNNGNYNGKVKLSQADFSENIKGKKKKCC